MPIDLRQQPTSLGRYQYGGTLEGRMVPCPIGETKVKVERVFECE
jgi:hypothetical protein